MASANKRKSTASRGRKKTTKKQSAPIRREIGATVEGYYATEAGYHLAQQQGVSMPITEAMYGVLYGGLSAKDGIRLLLARPRKGEHEEVWVE